MRPLHVLATAVVAVSCLQAPRAAEPAVAPRAEPQDVPGRMAVRAGVLHTMAGPPIEDGVLLIDGGRITAVGPASQVAVPAGWSVREAAVVTPGLIDARSSVGLAGWLNVAHDQDEVDRSESVQHTLHAMGESVLDAVGDITAIRLTMPNKHHLPFDLSRLGLENRNEIFVPTDEPHGVIEATITR